ncbi:hypothetical protein V6N13_105337 [Hibiscus sabdariffa]|uniref:Uncharacterized protein n=1 Tax=Hibiscus sabdariffa TaxID=183260 RepID=A0ABR2EWK4_9ROSI
MLKDSVSGGAGPPVNTVSNPRSGNPSGPGMAALALDQYRAHASPPGDSHKATVPTNGTDQRKAWKLNRGDRDNIKPCSTDIFGNKKLILTSGEAEDYFF